MNNLKVSIKKSSIYMFLMALNFVFLVSCTSDKPIKNENIENENDCYKQYSESYCGRGEYLSYGKRDITIGEVEGKPSIYFIDTGINKSIIYTNSECYAIYEIALLGEWIYFTERFGETRNNMKHYISCVKVDGSEYRKIKECKASMLCAYNESIYYKNNDKMISYNIVKNIETEIVDYVSEFCLNDGKLYLFNHHSRETTIIDIENGEKTTINNIFRKPIVRKNEIYYLREKSKDDAFKKNDVYYICKKGINGKENILYSTTDYIFSFVVLDETILVSQGKVNDFFESLEQQVDDISNLQAKLIKIQLGTSEETVIREDLSYHTDIYNTLNKLYFCIESWNGEQWIYQDENLALSSL